MIARRALKSVLQASSRVAAYPAMSRNYSVAGGKEFETLKVTTPRENVTHVELNRPEKRNAMNSAFWREMVECFEAISVDQNCRAVVISGAGKIFTAGLDLSDLDSISIMQNEGDVARKAFLIKQKIKAYQNTFSVIEKCPKPVIAAVHSACVGGGVDLVSACDIRYCTSDGWFQIKEVDIGLAADVGTLQRFPKIVGNDSLARELAFTARKFFADEARQMGFVSRILGSKTELLEAALDTAVLIASKSPVAVQGTKVSMVFSRDHSVEEGLDHVANWNQAMLQSEDVMKAAMGAMQKTTPVFSKL